MIKRGGKQCIAKKQTTIAQAGQDVSLCENTGMLMLQERWRALKQWSTFLFSG